MSENLEQQSPLLGKSAVWQAMVQLEQKAVIALFGLLIALMPYWVVSRILDYLTQQKWNTALASKSTTTIMVLGVLSTFVYLLSMVPRWLELRKQYLSLPG